MRINRATLRHAAAFLLPVGMLSAAVHPLAAQLATTGQISGILVDGGGTAVPSATLTLTREGAVVRIARGEISGGFTLADLAPGQYQLLAEQVGYQPVRVTAIPVAAGLETAIGIRLDRRPPPITSTDERRYDGAGPAAPGWLALSGRLDLFARSRAATDLGRDATALVGRFDGGVGSVIGGGGGLGSDAARLLVDGLDESLLRHPGMPGELGSAPIFARDGVSQMLMSRFIADPSLPATGGVTASAVSELGASGRTISPWLALSGASLGGKTADNPADSSARSIEAGVTLGGMLKGDSVSWFARLDYRDTEQPTAAALPQVEGLTPDALGEAALPASLAGTATPVVRRWSGVTGQAGMGYRLNKSWRLMARFGAADWTEEAPVLIGSATNGGGVTLDGQDLSFGAGVDYTSDLVTSITRVGLRSSSRDWAAAQLPYTTLGAEAAAFGTDPGLPGLFDESMIQIAQQFSFPVGRHVAQIGGMAGRRTFTDDYLPGATGNAAYGSFDDFVAGRGAFSRVSGGAADEVALLEYAVFADMVFTLSPHLRATAGLRYQMERLPLDLVDPSLEVAETFGVFNAAVPSDKNSGIGPRLSLDFHPGSSGRTALTLGGGLVPGRWDRAALSEVARHDGGVMVRRGLGDVSWPDLDGGEGAARYSFLAPTARAPRTFVLNGLLRQALAHGIELTLGASYHHTDYLLRRRDINRPAAALETGADGRPIWGTLDQVGSLIAPLPGSNTRIARFDHVYGLASTGYADNYELSVRLSRDLGAGLSVSSGYSYSRTTDNMVGALSNDVADRLAPLGDDTGWDEGTSDYDVPHRLVAQLVWHSPSDALTLGARFRLRSGLPFTAGFPRGTDVNGDGSSANDPVAVGSVAGLDALLNRAGCSTGDGFAERNGCREAAVHALDLQASIRLPLGPTGVRLTVDAFNLVASDVGLVDRAAVRVDPTGAIGHDAAGRVVLPLTLNEDFGRLLVRRNDPRTIRIGLRVEN